MTEAEHMLARVVVDPTTGKKTLWWRGLFFQGEANKVHVALDRDDGEVVSFYISGIIDDPQQWVWACSILRGMLNKLGQPVELHSIEDPDAYAAALDAYEAER